MKISREEIGTTLWSFFICMAIVWFFAADPIARRFSKSAGQQFAYGAGSAAIAAALIVSLVMLGMAVHASRKRRRVKVVTHAGDQKYGKGLVMDVSAAIESMIACLVKACGKEYVCIVPLEQRMFRFRLFRHRPDLCSRNVQIPTTTMTFFAEPEMITQIFDAFKAKLNESGMEALRPPLLRSIESAPAQDR